MVASSEVLHLRIHQWLHCRCPDAVFFVVSYSSTLHLKVSSIWECIPKIFERVLNQKSDLGRVLGNSSRVTGGTLRVQCQQFCCQVFWSVEPGCWCRDILLSQIYCLLLLQEEATLTFRLQMSAQSLSKGDSQTNKCLLLAFVEVPKINFKHRSHKVKFMKMRVRSIACEVYT